MKILASNQFISERVKVKPITNAEWDKIAQYLKEPKKSFFVWPVLSDFAFVNDHPHWIEMTMFDTKGNKVARCYIFDEDKLLKDANNFVEINTHIFVANVSQHELIARLEKYRIPFGTSLNIAFANEDWIEVYSVYQFKNEYINGNKY